MVAAAVLCLYHGQSGSYAPKQSRSAVRALSSHPYHSIALSHARRTVIFLPTGSRPPFCSLISLIKRDCIRDNG